MSTEQSKLCVGVDLVSVPEVTSSLQLHGARYKQRLFTTAEQGDCDRRGVAAAQSYAARFAAKEAVLKILAPDDLQPPWTDIEVVRAPSGACHLNLLGAARQLASAMGLDHWSISLSHQGELAIAMVAAQQRLLASPTA